MERDQPLARQHERDNRSIRQNASNVRVRALNMSKADHYSPPKYTLTHIHVSFGGLYHFVHSLYIVCSVLYTKCCTQNYFVDYNDNDRYNIQTIHDFKKNPPVLKICRHIFRWLFLGCRLFYFTNMYMDVFSPLNFTL